VPDSPAPSEIPAHQPTNGLGELGLRPEVTGGAGDTEKGDTEKGDTETGPGEDDTDTGPDAVPEPDLTPTGAHTLTPTPDGNHLITWSSWLKTGNSFGTAWASWSRWSSLPDGTTSWTSLESGRPPLSPAISKTGPPNTPKRARIKGQVYRQSKARISALANGQIRTQSPGLVRDRSKGQALDQSIGGTGTQFNGQARVQSNGHLQAKPNSEIIDQSKGQFLVQSIGDTQSNNLSRSQASGPVRAQYTGHFEGHSQIRGQSNSRSQTRRRTKTQAQRMTSHTVRRNRTVTSSNTSTKRVLSSRQHKFCKIDGRIFFR